MGVILVTFDYISFSRSCVAGKFNCNCVSIQRPNVSKSTKIEVNVVK